MLFEEKLVILFSENHMKRVNILHLIRSIPILITVFERLNSPPQDSELSASYPYQQPLVYSENETVGIQTRSGRSCDEDKFSSLLQFQPQTSRLQPNYFTDRPSRIIIKLLRKTRNTLLHNLDNSNIKSLPNLTVIRNKGLLIGL